MAKGAPREGQRHPDGPQMMTKGRPRPPKGSQREATDIPNVQKEAKVEPKATKGGGPMGPTIYSNSRSTAQAADMLCVIIPERALTGGEWHCRERGDNRWHRLRTREYPLGSQAVEKETEFKHYLKKLHSKFRVTKDELPDGFTEAFLSTAPGWEEHADLAC